MSHSHGRNSIVMINANESVLFVRKHDNSVVLYVFH